MVVFTALVLIVKTPEVCPAGIMMLAGTDATELPLERVIVAPPEGAGA